jgi:hypothetical protein
VLLWPQCAGLAQEVAAIPTIRAPVATTWDAHNASVSKTSNAVFSPGMKAAFNTPIMNAQEVAHNARAVAMASVPAPKMRVPVNSTVGPPVGMDVVPRGKAVVAVPWIADPNAVATGNAWEQRTVSPVPTTAGAATTTHAPTTFVLKKPATTSLFPVAMETSVPTMAASMATVSTMATPTPVAMAISAPTTITVVPTDVLAQPSIAMTETIAPTTCASTALVPPPLWSARMKTPVPTTPVWEANAIFHSTHPIATTTMSAPAKINANKGNAKASQKTVPMGTCVPWTPALTTPVATPP